jgi:hypothetical protein
LVLSWRQHPQLTSPTQHLERMLGGTGGGVVGSVGGETMKLLP